MALSLHLLLASPFALAEGFPGRGSGADWSDALPYYNLANKYLSKGRFDDAIEKYDEAILRYQFDPDFYTNMGLACMKAKRFAEADVALRTAIQLNNKDWSPWSNLASNYSNQGKLKESLAAFEQTLKLKPPALEAEGIKSSIESIKKILKAKGELPGEKPASKAKVTGKPPAASKKIAANPDPSPAKLSIQSNQDYVPSKSELKNSGWDLLY